MSHAGWLNTYSVNIPRATLPSRLELHTRLDYKASLSAQICCVVKGKVEELAGRRRLRTARFRLGNAGIADDHSCAALYSLAAVVVRL